jgi:hypothetical protein
VVRLGRFAGIVALVLSFGALAACGDDPKTPTKAPTKTATHSTTTGAVSDSTLISQIGDWATQWLRDIRGPAAQPLSCPSIVPGSLVASNSGDARGCLWTSGPRTVSLRVQNLTRVPLTISFAQTWFTLKPLATQDYRLVDPRYNQVVRFQRDARTAITSAIVDFANGLRNPAMQWKSCLEGLSIDCILTGLQTLLPPQVSVFGRLIPAQRIVSLAQQIWTYSPLVTTFNQQASGTGEGTLTFRSFCDVLPSC